MKWITVILTGLLTLTACVTQSETRQGPTPLPPKVLNALPRNGRGACSGGGAIPLWEYPGSTPDDPNSAYQGKRGRELGEISSCEKVLATSYAWSQMDGDFYVLVQNDSAKGWVELHLIEFVADPGGQIALPTQ